MRFIFSVTLGPALALAACSEPAPEPAEPVAEETPVPEIALDPLEYDEFSEVIEPGLGCSFQSESEDLLLVASAPAEEDGIAQAAIKVDGEVRVLTANVAGGFDALTGGGMFSVDGGAQVVVSREPGEGAPEGVESTAWPAKLDLRLDGEHRVYDFGRWSCGA